MDQIQHLCGIVGTVNPRTVCSCSLIIASIMEKIGNIKGGKHRSYWCSKLWLEGIHDKWFVMLLLRPISYTSVHRVHTFRPPPSRGLIWLSLHLLTDREAMEATPPLYPKLECWEKILTSGRLSYCKHLSATPSTSISARNASSTCFHRKSVGASEERRPFTGVELAAQQVAHHFFTSMHLQQQETLIALDQEVKAHPPPSMNLREETFPWKSEEFSRTAIPTQFCKLVEFYQTLCSFMA